MRNACLNSVNASLAPGVRKSDPTVLDLDDFLDLDVFRTFFPTSSTLTPPLSTSMLSIPLPSIPSCLALLALPTPFPPFLGSAVFSVEVSDAAIRLNP